MRTNRISQRANKLYDSLKSKAKFVQEWFLFSQTLNVIFLILLFSSTVFVFIFKIKVAPGEQALYYFLSSVAQSMAAIIALAGSVGVFIYSNISAKLKALKQLTREKFDSREWIFRIGITASLTWRDDEVISKAKAFTSMTLPPEIYNVLVQLVLDMESQQKSLDEYIHNALPSLFSSSFSFFSSLAFIPFSLSMSKAKVGFFFILFSLFLVSVSLRNIYKFFKTSLLK
jgi:hypothetical protein